MKKLKKGVLKFVTTTMSILIIMTSVSSAQPNVVDGNEKVNIKRIGQNSFMINDLEEDTNAIYTLNPDMKSGVISYEDGTKSYLTVETKYNNDNNLEYVSKVDGEIVLIAEQHTSDIDDTYMNELEEDTSNSGNQKASYNYELINRYTLKADALKKASAIITVVGLYLDWGNALTIAGSIIGLYKEFKVPRFTPLSCNVLYAKNAPMNLQIKSVVRIYKDSAATMLAKMYTYFRAV